MECQACGAEHRRLEFVTGFCICQLCKDRYVEVRGTARIIAYEKLKAAADALKEPKGPGGDPSAPP